MTRKEKKKRSELMLNARAAKRARAGEDALSPAPESLPGTMDTCTRKLRQKAPVEYDDAIRCGLVPYSEMAGTTGKQRGRDVKAVMDVIDHLSAGAYFDARRTELIQGLLTRAEFEQLVQPRLEYKILERGIKRKWEALA